MKGDALFTNGLFNESLSAYEKAIGYDPFSFKSWKGKGQVLLALNRSNDAAEAFLRALKLDPTDAATYALLGDAMSAGGEYQSAAEQYLKALAMNPKIEGVPEKLSAAYAAVNSINATETGTMGSPLMTPTPLDLQAVSTAEDTKMVTVEETTIVLPAPTKAGFPGTVTGILGVLSVLLLIMFRRN
jgi:tetratricopeptide (TPR) repeat protein